MNFNIALNTIVYILIFIFPGVLFRKFYYRGAFTKQFSQGNLFERFIITLFLSVVSLLTCISIILLLRYVFGIRFLNSVSYETIRVVFNTLKDNQLPEKKVFGNIYKDFTVLLLLIYFLSTVLGAISHGIILLFKIDVLSNVFRFNDKWYYHITGKTYDNLKGKKYLYTFANVLTEDGDKKVMYSGYLKDYCIDDNNNLSSVFLTNTHRYDYTGLENTEPSRAKYIIGNMMWISGSKILNINFTHVAKEKELEKFKKNVYDISTVIFYLLSSFTITIFWFDNFFIEFASILQKVFFIIIAFMIELLIYNLLKKILTQDKGSYNINGNITFSILAIVPLLWTLNVYNAIYILYIYGAMTVLLFLFAYFSPQKNNDTK
ncbi:hypothetical protein [Elizabethkingia meningoseptica]|uniref:hypothetical protein n=1 Tax=Elizabethkingia meningoseptica TaxID=238 RepID=UPI0038925B1E